MRRVTGGRAAAWACLVGLVAWGGPAAAGERWVFGAGVAIVQRTSPDVLERPLLGPTLSGTFLEIRDEEWRIRPGIDLQVTNAFRSDGLWVADTSIAFVATVALTEIAINPFVSFGPDAGYVVGDGDEDARWAIGVRGDVGFHGILFDWLYWRAKVGFVALGEAGLRTELLVGHAFDD